MNVSNRLTLWDLNLGDYHITDENPQELRCVWNKTATQMATGKATVTPMVLLTEYKWIKEEEAKKILVTRYNKVALEVSETQTTIGDVGIAP